MQTQFTKSERRKIYEDIISKTEIELERGICYFLSDRINDWCYYGCRTETIGTFPEFDLFYPDIRDAHYITYGDRIIIMQLCIEMCK